MFLGLGNTFRCGFWLSFYCIQFTLSKFAKGRQNAYLLPSYLLAFPYLQLPTIFSYISENPGSRPPLGLGDSVNFVVRCSFQFERKEVAVKNEISRQDISIPGKGDDDSCATTTSKGWNETSNEAGSSTYLNLINQYFVEQNYVQENVPQNKVIFDAHFKNKIEFKIWANPGLFLLIFVLFLNTMTNIVQNWL